jgi:hypothetical protein
MIVVSGFRNMLLHTLSFLINAAVQQFRDKISFAKIITVNQHTPCDLFRTRIYALRRVLSPNVANSPEKPHLNTVSFVCKAFCAPMYAPNKAPTARNGATRMEQFPAM